MPFGWKNKTRRSRFSQLVADHFQFPKRRRSMVVETGFPTSLIDLYVRNRGRFRKSSDKKQRGDDLNSLSSGDSDYRQTDEFIVASDRDINAEKYSETEAELSVGMAKMNQSATNSLVDLNNLLSSDSDCGQHDESIEEAEIKIEVYSKAEEERGVGMAKLNPVLVVVLKVLLMVVLVLGSKSFTIAVTLLAFLLFFLELVGKRLLGRSVSMRRSGDSKQAATVVVCSEVLEIEEQAESKQNELDEVRREGFIEIRGKSSRRAMMKSRIKKLVPKKLRIRKSSMDSKHNMCCEFKEEERVVCLNECSDSKGKILETGRRSSSSTLSSEIECDDGELGADLRQNTDCLVLFLIVLVGLIEGRVFALVIALSWCMMLKLQCRNVKFSIS